MGCVSGSDSLQRCYKPDFRRNLRTSSQQIRMCRKESGVESARREVLRRDDPMEKVDVATHTEQDEVFQCPLHTADGGGARRRPHNEFCKHGIEVMSYGGSLFDAG